MNTCAVCNRSFSRKCDLNRHLNRKVKCTAPQNNNNENIIINNISENIEVKNDKQLQQKFTCIICKEIYDERIGLYCHIKNNHNNKSGQDKYKCLLCETICKTQLDFIDHMKTHANYDDVIKNKLDEFDISVILSVINILIEVDIDKFKNNEHDELNKQESNVIIRVDHNNVNDIIYAQKKNYIYEIVQTQTQKEDFDKQTKLINKQYSNCDVLLDCKYCIDINENFIRIIPEYKIITNINTIRTIIIKLDQNKISKLKMISMN